MKKIIATSLLALSLVACSKENSTFICGAYQVDITMAEDGESITAVINGDEMTLNHAISASGVRYVGELNDTVVTLWNKGSDWTMYLNEEDGIKCHR